MAKLSLSYYQTVQVAKVKTDLVQYTTITLAIAAITARGSPVTGKRFAVYVHPGSYDETVGMVDYVDVIAIGGREETVITHLETTTDHIPTVSGANAMIKGFTIESDGTTKIPRCVSADADGFEIDDCVLDITVHKADDICLAGTASFDMRHSVVDKDSLADTGLSLAEDAKAYNIHDCEINSNGAGDAIAIADNTLTLNLTTSHVTDNIDMDGGTAHVKDCILEAIDFDKGTLNLHESYVETIAADNAGTVTAYGGTIRACTSSGTTFVWWLSDHELKVIVNMKIAHALALPPPADSVIHITPGTYGEANLAMVAGVGLVGTDPDLCSIIASSETTPIITSAVDCFLSNLNIGGTHADNPAIFVTADQLILKNCYVYGTGVGDAIGMTGGALVAYDTQIGVGDINLATNACGLAMYRCRITTDPVDTANDVVHTLVFEQCDFGNQNLASAAVGATTLDMTGCSHVGQVSNAGTGPFTIRDSDLGDVTTTSTGDITVFGGDVGICAGASADGDIVWWLNSRELMVIESMLIQHAIDAATDAGPPTATDPYVVRVGPGTYSEKITMDAYCDVVAVSGRAETVITNLETVTDHAATVTGDNAMIKGFTIESDGTTKIPRCVTNAIDGLEIVDCVLDVTVHNAGDTCLAGTASFTMRDSIVDSGSLADTGISLTNDKTWNIENSELNANGTNAVAMTNGTLIIDKSVVENGAIDLATNACVLGMYNSQMLDAGITTAADNVAHTIEVVQCDLHGGGVNSAAAGVASTTTLDMRGCSNVGKLTNAGIGNFTVRDSDVQDCETTDATINAGHITIEGGDVGTCAGASADGDIVWWKHTNLVYVLPGMLVAHAVAAVSAGDTIQLSQGTWAESDITIAVSINIIGEGLEESLISTGDDTNPILQIGDVADTVVACTIQGVTVQNTGTQEAIELVSGTETTTVVARECYIDGGSAAVALAAAGAGVKTFEAFECTFNAPAATCIDVDCTAAIADIDIHNCEFTAGAVANLTGNNHTFDAWDCEMGGGGITVAADVPPIVLIRCNDVGAIGSLTNTLAIEHCTVGNVTTTTGGVTIEHSTVGILVSGNATVNVYNSRVAEANPSNGTQTYYECQIALIDSDGTSAIVVHGGNVESVDAPVSGTVVWWEGDHILKVMASTGNMKIADALAVATSGDTIKIGQSTAALPFAESNLTAVDGVDIVGEGQDISIIEATDDDNPIITVGSNVSCVFKDVKISNLGTHQTIDLLAGTDPAVLTVENCILKSDGANSIVVATATGTDPADFTAYDTIFDTAADAITVSGATISDVVARACVFKDCTLAFTTTGAAHIFRIDGCDFSQDNVTFAGVTLTADAPVVTIHDTSGIGLFGHSCACTVNLKNCRFRATYTIGAFAGIVNAEACEFSTFTNGGSGAIAFQECYGTNINNNQTSAMVVEGGNWDTVLQGAANGDISIYEANIATKLQCGADVNAWIKAYNCHVVDIDSDGGTITLYGGSLEGISTAIAAAGVVVWWEAPHRLRVIASTGIMKIMDAADAAAAGDTILIGPGTFTEALVLDAAVNVCTYKGFGRDKTIITQDSDEGAEANTVLVSNIGTATIPVVFEDLTIQLNNAADGEYSFKVNAATAAAAALLRNVTIDTNWKAGTVYGLWAVDAAANVATVEAYDCNISATGGATSYAVAADDCDSATSSIKLYDCILNGTTYDVYDDTITIELHDCELNGAGVWISDAATSIVLAYNNEAPNTVTPVTFAGPAGEFADLTGAELYTCLGTVLIGEAVYVSAAGNTVVEATNAAAAPIPAEGIVVYKPAGAAGTTCYVKNSGMLYMATPPAVWAAGTNVWLGAAGAQLVARPSNALKQVLGVGVDTKRMLINISEVEVVTKVATIPVWPGAGTAPTGTHINGNARKAVAIVGAAGQTVYSHAWEVPEDFLSLGALKVIVFPTGTGSFDWTAYSSACANGELDNEHTDSDTDDAVDVTDNTILDHAITTAADAYVLQEGDHFNCDIVIDTLTTITQLLVLGFRVEYNAQRGA